MSDVHGMVSHGKFRSLALDNNAAKASENEAATYTRHVLHVAQTFFINVDYRYRYVDMEMPQVSTLARAGPD